MKWGEVVLRGPMNAWHLGPGATLCPSCSNSQAAPCCVLGQPLDPSPVWETGKKPLAPGFGRFSSGYCSHMESEPVNGKSLSLFLFVNLPFNKSKSLKISYFNLGLLVCKLQDENVKLKHLKERWCGLSPKQQSVRQN